MAARYGVTTVDTREQSDVAGAVRELTGGRGADAVIDAVGMEAHGAPGGWLAHQVVGMLPKPLAAKMTERAGVDQLSVLYQAIETVRRGGSISLSGVYGGVDPMPMMELFDKQIQLRMGQANVRRWLDDVLPIVQRDDDPLGVEDLTTHRMPLDEAPTAYRMFQQKQDGVIKVLLHP